MLLMIISLVDWCIKEGTKRQFNYAKYGIILSVTGWGNVHWGDSKVFESCSEVFVYSFNSKHGLIEIFSEILTKNYR